MKVILTSGLLRIKSLSCVTHARALARYTQIHVCQRFSDMRGRQLKWGAAQGCHERAVTYIRRDNNIIIIIILYYYGFE